MKPPNNKPHYFKHCITDITGKGTSIEVAEFLITSTLTVLAPGRIVQRSQVVNNHQDRNFILIGVSPVPNKPMQKGSPIPISSSKQNRKAVTKGQVRGISL
jgi:hypothetical protein